MSTPAAPERLMHRLAPLWFALVLALAGVGSSRGAESERRAFDIVAGEAVDTLRAFAAQANREIMFPAERVHGVRTRAVKGTFTPREAVERMLAGTTLHV